MPFFLIINSILSIILGTFSMTLHWCVVSFWWRWAYRCFSLSGNKLNLKIRDVGVPCPFMNCQAADIAFVSWPKVPSSSTLISPSLFILSPLIKLKRGMGSVWGCSVGGKAWQKWKKCVESMTLCNTVITQMPHQSLHLHLTVTFSPPYCFISSLMTSGWIKWRPPSSTAK